MIGRVNRYNPNKHTGYIYNIVNGLTCMFKDSDVLDGDIANGYIVEFGLEYDEEMQRKCAKLRFVSFNSCQRQINISRFSDFFGFSGSFDFFRSFHRRNQ